MKKEKDVEQQKVKKAVEKTQSKIEISTLGELEAFASLKQQFQASAKEPKAEPPAAPAAEVKEAPAAEVSETVQEAEAEVKAPAKAKKSSGGDDLKIIEGIGPKIAELLVADGISNFAELAQASQEQLKAVLEKGGSRYKMHDPSTWPQQALLASEGKMDELKALQDSLKGGKAE